METEDSGENTIFIEETSSGQEPVLEPEREKNEEVEEMENKEEE